MALGGGTIAMAFWGCHLQPGKKFMLKANEGGNVLHLSQACLRRPMEGKNWLMVIDGKSRYAIACLEKGKTEFVSFDLFFLAGQYGFNRGDSEVHLTGFWDLNDMRDDMEDEEEEEE